MTLSRIRRRSLFAAPLLAPLAAAPAAAGAEGAPSLSAAPRDFESLLRPTIYPAADGAPRWRLAERMSHHAVPGAAVAILRDGVPAHLAGYGTRVAGATEAVDEHTVFSVGSVSKVATAALCLRLVAAGLLDLDRDIATWLRRWRPGTGPNGDASAITLRMILSHTAGFNVHGFPDFPPGVPLPDLVETLTGAATAGNEAVRRIEPAGRRARYSGGGVMVAQMVMEDATGQPLEALARAHLFGPLGMTRSTYANPLPATWGNIAHAHDARGAAAALPRGWQSFPEQAASGLWTSANDLSALIAALVASYRRPAGGYLPRSLAIDMMTAVAPGIYGLGPRLSGVGAARMFHHGGANDSYRAYVEGRLESGDGVVVLTNGANGDVLGDEIRNAVSDTFGWPGDWSVATPDPAVAGDLAAAPGRYSLAPGQPAEVVGSLDPTFLPDAILLELEGGALGLRRADSGRSRPLAPVAPGRFIIPDAYVAAGTLQIELTQRADHRVSGLVVDNGAGRAFYRRDDESAPA